MFLLQKLQVWPVGWPQLVHFGAPPEALYSGRNIVSDDFVAERVILESMTDDCHPASLDSDGDIKAGQTCLFFSSLQIK